MPAGVNVRRKWYALALVALVVGCVQQYRPPAANEPHAIVKIRRSYHSFAGQSLRESAFIGDYEAMDNVRPAQLDTSESLPIRVHPGPLTWRVGSNYFHTETRMVTETYYVQVPYSASESYSCGYGTNYRTCYRTVTRYRSEPRTRHVMRNVEVSDGSCAMQVDQMADVGHVYLLQYSYTGPGVCSLQCLEQIPSSPGQFTTQPCQLPPRQ